MRTASSTASCAAGVWANTAVVTSKRVNRVRIAVLDARGTDLVAGPRGSAPLNLSCKHPIRSREVAGTLRAYRRQPGNYPETGPWAAKDAVLAESSRPSVALHRAIALASNSSRQKCWIMPGVVQLWTGLLARDLVGCNLLRHC